MPLQTPAKSWPEGDTGQVGAIASGEKILENKQGRAGRKQEEKDDPQIGKLPLSFCRTPRRYGFPGCFVVSDSLHNQFNTFDVNMLTDQISFDVSI